MILLFSYLICVEINLMVFCIPQFYFSIIFSLFHLINLSLPCIFLFIKFYINLYYNLLPAIFFQLVAHQYNLLMVCHILLSAFLFLSFHGRLLVLCYRNSQSPSLHLLPKKFVKKKTIVFLLSPLVTIFMKFFNYRYQKGLLFFLYV